MVISPLSSTEQFNLNSTDRNNNMNFLACEYTVEWVLIVWFNDSVLGKSGQIANLIIVKVDPLPYYSSCT